MKLQIALTLLLIAIIGKIIIVNISSPSQQRKEDPPTALENKKEPIIIHNVLPAHDSQPASEINFNYSVFENEGLPPPQDGVVTLDPEALKLWKSHFVEPAVKAANALGVDIGWVGFWSFYEGINYKTTFNNCNEDDDRFNPNKICSSNAWQVGPAVRPYDLPISVIQDAFDTMYGAHDKATIQRVGQRVIDNMKSRHNVQITYPATTFPQLSIEDLIQQSTTENRHWFVHLTRDDAIGMYYIARLFKGHVDAEGNMSDRMCGWGACGPGAHYDPQRTINFIKAVYDAGISGSSSGTGGNFNTSKSFTLKLLPLPEADDSYIKNEVIAEVIGAKSGTGSASAGTGTGLPGQPLPSNPSQAKQVLCREYRVCPTESANDPPNQPWTLSEITALWNVTQRIAASPAYRNIVVGGGPGIEVQRIRHCPGCAGWVQGYQAGTGTGGSTIPGSSLIYITNNANQGFSNAYLEWLYAHEIGHIAQHPPANALSAVNACGETVSAYGRNSRTENFADSVSFYMTNGEQAQEYLGRSGNLKNDFPCTYNALRNSAFGGAEF